MNECHLRGFLSYVDRPIHTSPRLVFIQDFELAKEVAFDERFKHRLEGPTLSNLRGYEGRKIGVAMTEGDTWRAHRRFTLSTLKGVYSILLRYTKQINDLHAMLDYRNACIFRRVWLR